MSSRCDNRQPGRATGSGRKTCNRTHCLPAAVAVAHRLQTTSRRFRQTHYDLSPGPKRAEPSARPPDANALLSGTFMLDKLPLACRRTSMAQSFKPGVSQLLYIYLTAASSDRTAEAEDTKARLVFNAPLDPDEDVWLIYISARTICKRQDRLIGPFF